MMLPSDLAARVKQNAERQGRIIQQLSDMEDRHICERAEQREKCKTQDVRISSIEKSQWLATGASVFTFGLRSNADTSHTNEKMRIRSDGNVGIGTTAPGTTLDVNDGATIRGQETVTSSMTVQGIFQATGNSHLGTATGTQLYRCTTGSLTNMLVYGSGTIATYCTASTATGVYLP